MYQIKTEIARSHEGSQLVLVGGSDVLFGISCQMIHKTLDIPCTNAGTHAGLGPDYLLYAAKSLLSPGDTALFSVPYNLFRDKGRPNSTLIDYVLARDPDYLGSVDLLSRSQFFTGITFARIIEGYAAKISPPGADPFSAYQSKNLNSYGDETVNLQAENIQKFASAVDQLMPQDWINGYLSDSNGMEKIRDFADWCRQQNIRLLVTYPNSLWFDEYDSPGSQAFFQSITDFYQSLDVPILGEYRDFLYDKSMLFDTAYHLNDRGVRARTRTIIEQIEPLF